MASKQVISTEDAPRAIGPYSPCIRAGNLVYTAGQIGIDPQTGELVAGEIEEQTRQVLHNVQALLEAAGTSLKEVVKTTVYLQDMADFSRMNGVYAEFFQAQPPARTTVAVAGLPKGALVEIEAVAVVDREE